MARAAWLVGVALLTAATTTRADQEKPWVVGVSEESKAAAKVLLEAGNKKFVERDYVAALEAYKQAIEKWDHPAIRFNMVRCLVQLDRVLEASENLELALKYGAAPLEEAVYSDALAFQKLLANQIGTIEVTCEQAGAAVTLDGEPLLACPGTAQKRVKPGRHQLVATKSGFLTQSTDVFAIGGATETVAVKLAPYEKVGKVVHRWATWMPWVVVGAGLTVTGVGGLVLYQAHQDMEAYDRALVAACLSTGCGPDHPVPEKVADQKSRAQLENRLGVGAMSVGIATVVTGGVLLYLNRARTVYSAEVAPAAGGATVSVTGRF